MIISGKLLNNAPISSTPASIISGKWSCIALTRLVIISGITATIVLIISDKLSTKAVISLTPVSIIFGIQASNPFTMAGITLTTAETMLGICVTKNINI